MNNTYITKSGKVLTEDDIAVLVEKAERGYDVENLKPLPAWHLRDSYGNVWRRTEPGDFIDPYANKSLLVKLVPVEVDDVERL